MAKKTKKDQLDEFNEIGVFDENVTEVTIDEYIKEIIIKYGCNVSIFRMSPSCRDGLIPVTRRTLFSFYKDGATYNQRRKKASDLLGRVAGYHPHGNLSIENAFKNEIKAYESNAVLYDTHGNTGSSTGQKSAAIRYLDTRLSMFACYCFFHRDDYYEELLDMTDTYTRDKKEPRYLQSRYPYFLLTNITGIGWGHSFSGVPFNLEEVFQLTKALLRNPEMKNVYLYPDSPRGYDIIESDDIIDFCEGGKYTLKIQARMEYHQDKKYGRYISVTGFPEQTNMDSITAAIANMILKKELPGVIKYKDMCKILEDESEHVEFWLMLTNDADVEYIKETLYKKTQLRHFLSVNSNYANTTSMAHLGLKESLLMWISNRISYKSKVIAKKVYKLKERIYVLEGITEMLLPKNIDTTIRLIKTANDREEANRNLVNHYGVSSYQANCVSGVRLYDMTKLDRSKSHEELAKLKKELKETMEIMGDTDKIKDIIEEELDEGIKLFGKPRACRVISKDALQKPKSKFNVVVTKKYVKKLSANSKTVGIVAPDDEVIAYFHHVEEDKSLYVVDDFGKVYYIKLDKLNPCSATTRGDDLVSIAGVKGTPIRAFMSTDKDVDEMSIVFFTEFGIIKQTKLSAYTSNRTEVQGIVLNNDDKVCYVLIYGSQEYEESPFVLIYTNLGSGIALDLQQIPYTDRMTKGSRFLNLEDNDSVRGVCPTTSREVFVVTTKGYCKISELDDIFKTSKRRAAMIRLVTVGDDDQVFRITPFIRDDGKYVVMLQDSKIELLKTDIKSASRLSKGYKTIPVKRGDSIVKIKEV